MHTFGDSVEFYIDVMIDLTSEETKKSNFLEQKEPCPQTSIVEVRQAAEDNKHTCMEAKWPCVSKGRAVVSFYANMKTKRAKKGSFSHSILRRIIRNCSALSNMHIAC